MSCNFPVVQCPYKSIHNCAVARITLVDNTRLYTNIVYSTLQAKIIIYTVLK